MFVKTDWISVKFLVDNVFLIALVLLSGGMLLAPLIQQRGNRVSLLRATQLINQGKTVVVDVRTPEEFAAGHLRDAKNIPRKELPQRAGEIDKNKTKSVIVVCRSGTEAARAAAQLNKAGFTDVYCLDGGIDAWQANGLPTTR